MKWMTKASMMSAFAFVIMSTVLWGMPEVAYSASAASAKARLAAIESISAAGEGNSTELMIKLSSPATYTSYKTTAPLRLVIDLSQTTSGAVTAPLIINKGNFKTVTVSRFDTDAGVLTRIDVELVKDSEAILTAAPSSPGELRVAFPSLKDSIPVATDSSMPTKPVIANSNELPVPETAITSPNSAEAAKLKLTSIKTVNNTIVLELDGTINDFKSFRLNKPERYVVDLMNVQSSLPTRLLPLNTSGVASARIGLYPDKVRVVLDAVNGTFPDVSAAKVDNGIILTLNPKAINDNSNTKLTGTHSAESIEKPSVKDSVATASSESAVTKPVKTSYSPSTTTNSKGPSNIEMIDFQVIDGISRISVKVKGEISADQPLKTAGFITLTIKNTVLPKNLQRSLETQSFVSPVLRVTPLMVKTKYGTDTKVRIAMRTTAPFEMRQEGDMLFVDIRNPEGLTADRLVTEATDIKNKPQRQAASKTRDDELSTEFAPAAESSTKQLEAIRGYKGRKVTLEFADAEVRKIFQLLSEVSNKNFVLGDDVTGAISLKLVNVPWDQALDIILDTKGLDKREDGNIILIKGKGKFKSQAEEEQEIKKALIKAIELKTETFSINYADIGTIASQFNGLKSDRGTISQDARTNKVIVKDIPQILSEMRKLLVQLDVPEKQVMIEARIVEASSTFTRNLGVNWGIHYRDGSASFLGINSLDTGFGGLTSAPPTTGTGSNAGGSMGISFGTLSSNIQLDMRLNAAASAGMVKIVSTPKVATLNNKTAKITQGQQIPYTSSTSDKVETKFIEAALSLEVTPHINANGTIGMKIDAKNDSPGQSTGASAPPINKKQATTEMLLRDGETTVIGGIYVDSDNTSDEGVPYLMDIPLLGKLFKTNNKTKTKTELLIFITPRILGTI